MEEEKGASAGPSAVIVRLQNAMNGHDLEAMAACFDPDYESEFPAHPDRAFRGDAQMRKNWTQIFGAVPNLEAVLKHTAVDGDTIWAEWEWRGTRRDGAPHLMRGVTVQGVRQGRIAWVRLYMEPVQQGNGTEAALGAALRLNGPPRTAGSR